jgi:hypothetical protein
MLARAQYFLGYGFLIFGKEAGDAAATAELVKAHRAGADAAEAGLRALSPDFDRLRRQDAPLAEAIDVLGREAAPLLYWWAQNQIMWANAEGFGTTVKWHQVVYRVMEQVAELDRDYWYAGADRYFATVLAAAPAIAGGDLAKAKTRFEECLKRAPQYLDTYVLFAVLYARAAKDDTLFARLLQQVVDAPDDWLPEIAPEQALAKRKARKLLGLGP